MQRVIICGLCTKDEAQFASSMEELAGLVETAGGTVVASVVQNRPEAVAKTLIGKGKLEELAQVVRTLEADLVVFNSSLSPSQAVNIEVALQCSVLDRTQLILDIFALRARSKEGKLQVAKAQIDYLLPRLNSVHANLSRLGGGIGTRGPGETKLETDRRHLRQQQYKIQKELKQVEKHRTLARKQRQEGLHLNIGLVGYTNAGKSTLLTALTQKETYIKDELFATLDPLTRRWVLPNGLEATLTDTVGFIQDLPTTLVEAFHSTLEEIQTMDLLFHVVDMSHPQHHQQEETVLKVLEELGAAQLPRLTIYTKKDLATTAFTPTLFPNIQVFKGETNLSAKVGTAVEALLKDLWIPYHVHLAPADSAAFYAYQHHTLLSHWELDERGQYYLQGYAPKERKFNEF